MTDYVRRRLKAEGWQGNWHEDYVDMRRKEDAYFDNEFDLGLPLDSEGKESEDLRKQGFVGVWKAEDSDRWIY